MCMWMYVCMCVCVCVCVCARVRACVQVHVIVLDPISQHIYDSSFNLLPEASLSLNQLIFLRDELVIEAVIEKRAR